MLFYVNWSLHNFPRAPGVLGAGMQGFCELAMKATRQSRVSSLLVDHYPSPRRNILPVLKGVLKVSDEQRKDIRRQTRCWLKSMICSQSKSMQICMVQQAATHRCPPTRSLVQTISCWNPLIFDDKILSLL